MSGTIRTAVVALAAGDKVRPCSPATKRCDFWAWGEGNLRPACCTAHLLELTGFVHELLERRGIVHWLDYGTLLGAVREGELIPWDEDVDFGILATDVAAVRELKPEIEAAGHRLDDSWYPHVLRIQLSRANTIHVDLFVWEERDGLLMHRADSTWDWPGMQDRVAFSPAHLQPTEEVVLAGRPYPAPSPPHEFLRLHRYGDGYLTPRRATVTTRLHFDIDSSQATPLVEKLLAEVARREQLLLRAIRAGSLLTRMRLWDSDSDVAAVWTALPLEPGDDYLERELASLSPSDRSETALELGRALAWLQQGIDEYERPHRGTGTRRMGRRLNRLARAGRRKGATTLASLLA